MRRLVIALAEEVAQEGVGQRRAAHHEAQQRGGLPTRLERERELRVGFEPEPREILERRLVVMHRRIAGESDCATSATHSCEKRKKWAHAV